MKKARRSEGAIFMKKKKIICYIFIGVSFLFALVLAGLYGRQETLQKGIADKILRFHVLANSDSEEDQKLKLAVRDAVGAKMGELLSGVESREEAKAVVLSKRDVIIETAEKTILEAGYDYTVDARLGEVEFPKKTYGKYTFPAGKYEALEVIIGEGEGQNWWCVMYPNMCFSGTVYEVVEDRAEEELREVLSEEEYENVLNSGNYEVRFKYFSFLNR